MLHFTCDLCGMKLGDERFVARVEVYPAFDPEEIDEDDLDADHLEQVADALAEMESNGETLDECGHQEFRYDLCPKCHEKYRTDPLARHIPRRLNFSDN